MLIGYTIHCGIMSYLKHSWVQVPCEAGFEDEVVGWHHRLNGHELEQTPGDGEG